MCETKLLCIKVFRAGWLWKTFHLGLGSIAVLKYPFMSLQQTWEQTCNYKIQGASQAS